MVRAIRRPTLRVRLVALLVALLTLAFVLVAAVTTFALHGFLQNRLDQQLRAAGTRFSVSLEHPDSDVDSDDDRQFGAVTGQAAGTLGARVLNGRVTAAAVVPSTEPGRAARAVLGTLHATSTPRTIDLPRLGDYRVTVTPGDDGDLLVTGLPTSSVEDTIARLVGIEAVVYAGALLLVAVSGGAFVRLALRPLTRVADTAARVADLPLASGTVSLPERAPQPDTHTEVGTLSDAFNHMLEHVETALHSRQDSEERLRRFVADASHELRTPVAVVRGHAELALRMHPDLPTDLAGALRRIESEATRMGHLVDDLLLLARLDSGRRLADEQVDVTHLVLDVVGDARVAGQEHRWQLDLPEEPVVVRGDDRALHQVMANLLANARTHTPAGTTVVTSVEQRGTGVRVVVADDGPGIPTQVLPRIFERFTRADETRTPTTGSSGLGLAIVDAVVRRLGGSIQVTSVPGDTRFTIDLGQPFPADDTRPSQDALAPESPIR